MKFEQIASGTLRGFHIVVSLALLAAGLAALWFGIEALHQGQLPLAGTSLTAGLVLLLSATIDRFESIKGLGMEAKTLVKRAETTLAEMHELAEVFANQVLTLEIRAGRMDGNDDDKLAATKEKVLRMLDRVGVPKDRLPSILREWDDTIEFDYAHYILRAANRAPERQVTPDQNRELNRLAEGGFDNRQTPTALRTALGAMELITPNIDALLTDYTHFVEHRQHRRPHEWRRREEWAST